MAELTPDELLRAGVTRTADPSRPGDIHELACVLKRASPIEMRQVLDLRAGLRPGAGTARQSQRQGRGEAKGSTPHAAAFAARFLRVAGCTNHDTPMLITYRISMGLANTHIVSTSEVGVMMAAMTKMIRTA